MATSGTRIRRHAWIRGYVQGVNFREAMRREAERLHVTGWVKNLPDGGVEAVFEGAPDAIQQLLSWCQHGPPAARVETVDLKSEPATSEFLSFRVHR